MSQEIIKTIEQSQVKADLPRLNVGDTVDVHVRIIEGSKERIQVFTGVIIKRQGQGLTETITVRRIVDNEGVERTFRLHSPKISKFEVVRHGHTRRAKLYYLRDRVGKKRRLRDRRRGLRHLTTDSKTKKPTPEDRADTTPVADETSAAGADEPVEAASSSS